MGQVITMPEDRHREAEQLLPWFVAGTLDEADRAQVEYHLADCVACRAELATEKRLAAAVATDSPASQDGWSMLQARLKQADLEPAADVATPSLPPVMRPRSASRGGWARLGRTVSDPQRLRWIVGAQFAALLVLGAVTAVPVERPGAYRALGDASAVRHGNALVMFRPDTSEAALRRALSGVDARLVDGPTSAGAYVLEVPGDRTNALLARLRSNPDVTMAEPIEEGAAE